MLKKEILKMEFFNYLHSIKYRTRWEQRSMWRTLLWDSGGISEEEKEEIQDLILSSHARDSADLADLYNYTWFTRGAWKQAVLDKQVFYMLYLLHHHSKVNDLRF